MTEFATRCVHAGLSPDPSFGSIIPAIHQSSTYVQPAPGEFVGDFDYSRSANPTRAALETALGELEGGLASAFSSGMAAEHALITAVGPGHMVIPNDLYGGTYRLVDKVLSRFGIEYSMVDQRDLDAVAAAVRDDTNIIWVETPTNPTLNVIDLAGITGRADPSVDQGVIVIAAGDHGVATQGVSAYPSDVTAQMVANFMAKNTTINVLNA